MGLAGGEGMLNKYSTKMCLEMGGAPQSTPYYEGILDNPQLQIAPFQTPARIYKVGPYQL